MGRFGYGHGGGCDCYCHSGPGLSGRGPFWRWQAPATKDEMVDEMEDYKARLEAEITALEKRIKSLKEKE
jgi:hypothetical protein